jgi:hypothetical protein
MLHLLKCNHTGSFLLSTSCSNSKTNKPQKIPLTINNQDQQTQNPNIIIRLLRSPSSVNQFAEKETNFDLKILKGNNI